MTEQQLVVLIVLVTMLILGLLLVFLSGRKDTTPSDVKGRTEYWSDEARARQGDAPTERVAAAGGAMPAFSRDGSASSSPADGDLPQGENWFFRRSAIGDGEPTDGSYPTASLDGMEPVPAVESELPPVESPIASSVDSESGERGYAQAEAAVDADGFYLDQTGAEADVVDAELIDSEAVEVDQTAAWNRLEDEAHRPQPGSETSLDELIHRFFPEGGVGQADGTVWDDEAGLRDQALAEHEAGLAPLTSLRPEYDEGASGAELSTFTWTPRPDSEWIAGLGREPLSSTDLAEAGRKAAQEWLSRYEAEAKARAKAEAEEAAALEAAAAREAELAQGDAAEGAAVEQDEADAGESVASAGHLGSADLEPSELERTDFEGNDLEQNLDYPHPEQTAATSAEYVEPEAPLTGRSQPDDGELAFASTEYTQPLDGSGQEVPAAQQCAEPEYVDITVPSHDPQADVDWSRIEQDRLEDERATAAQLLEAQHERAGTAQPSLQELDEQAALAQWDRDQTERLAQVDPRDVPEPKSGGRFSSWLKRNF